MIRKLLPVMVAALVLLGISACPQRGADLGGPTDAGADVPHFEHFGATMIVGPADSGGVLKARNGVQVPTPSPVDIRDPLDFYPSFPDSSANGVWGILFDGGTPAPVLFTQDLINGLPAAFTESLAFASGSGSYELSQPATPTYNATPATNDVTVTGCTIADNQGHSASAISRANAINVDSPSGPHSYALTSAGSVTVTVTCTKISTSTPKSGSATLSYFTRGGWHGVDSHSGGNTITASSSNVTLGGGSATATLTGSSLVSSFVGTSFTESPSSQYIYAAYPHTGSAHTFTAGGFFFPMSVVVASFSFTNQWGQTSIPVDIYRSDNLLNATFVVVVTS